MPLRLAVSVLAAAAIGYEILLIRLFSIIQWHHFAFMVISLALLGYGASGTFLTLVSRRLGLDDLHRERRLGVAFMVSAALFSLLAVGAFALAQRVPFNPLEMAWDPRQFWRLWVVYLLLALPFFSAGTAIGLALMRARGKIHRVYRADLVGAGVGALGIVAILFVAPATTVLVLVGSLGLVAAGIAGLDRSLGVTRKWIPLFGIAAVLFVWIWPQSWLAPQPSEYKGLSKTMLVPATRILAEDSSPLGRLTVVASSRIPFRHAPGLSLAFPDELPEQLGLFTDGDSMSAIDLPGSGGEVSYLEYLPSALPYHLLDRPRVLILGAGGGGEISSALHHGVRRVDAVEFNPQVVRLVDGLFDNPEQSPYRRPGVRVHVEDARSFLARGRDLFELILVPPLDSSTVAAAGSQSASASFLYTVESFGEALSRLEQEGLLAVSRWLKVPPRDSLKLFATAVVALERSGVDAPAEHLAMIRSWSTVTLVVGRRPLAPRQLEALRTFSRERSFDLAFYPGIEQQETNRYNRLEAPYLAMGAEAILGADREEFYDRYKFNVRPATDDRPFFFNFFKWSVLPELLELRGRGGTPLVEWGYLIGVATLVQALVAAVVLILLPLGALGGAGQQAGGSVRVVVYFGALGLAFLMLEVVFIQKLTLFLGHPLYAVALVLAAFLVFAGLGSGSSAGLEQAMRRRARVLLGTELSAIEVSILSLAALSLTYLLLLPPVLRSAIQLPVFLKVPIALALLAPPAFLMGMPFPLGLARAADLKPVWVPWAWGINGSASVVSAALTPILAIHLGFGAVTTLAAALYLVAAASFRGLQKE
ncbi:MAG: SAM-dependent methyltransferase [Acidobacteria bacterium]|nr:MAG: SAM-dependent methyltransferase [Acidobacteriota bacterium]